MDQVAIGARIKAARERVHLTQEQLAEIIDISPTHMSVIERGVKTPKLDTFVRIANALGVSTDALLQDVVVPANESILAELSVRIGRLPQKDQERILNAIRALTE
jgi:transcriptional regulator with XRE-family HTH domain